MRKQLQEQIKRLPRVTSAVRCQLQVAPFELLASLERLSQHQLEQRAAAVAAAATDASASAGEALEAAGSEAQRILAAAQSR